MGQNNSNFNYYTNYVYQNPNNLLFKAKRRIYKWWCVVYRPVYKLTHQGYWPNEKEPYMVFPDENEKNPDTVQESVPEANAPEEVQTSETIQSEPEIDTSNVDSAVLDRANEIMARLAAEAADDEAKKQSEIDEAKRKSAEEEQLARIMQANKIDINPFIEEGLAMQQETTSNNI